MLKRIKFIIGIMFFIIVIISSLFLIFHFYFSKLNQKSVQDISFEITEEEIEEFIRIEQDENAINSSKEKILKVEEDIKNNINNNMEIFKDKNVMNILLVGSDTRVKGQFARSDSMIIVSINRNTKEIITTSLLRDTYVEIPGHSNNKLNAAYAYGGIELLEETIEKNFKISIDRYISVDFFSFVEIVDILGGVDLDITEKEVEYVNAYMHEINELQGYDILDDKLETYGNVTLDGRQALSYCRIRYIGTDFGRTERQRKTIQAIFNKTKNSNITTLNKLCLNILPLITTDLTESEVLELLMCVVDFKNYDIISNYIPYENTYEFCVVNKMSIISIDFESNIKRFNALVYGENS